MDNLDPVAHVDPEILIELGRVTILAGKLETFMNGVARSLGVAEPAKYAFSKVADASKKQINKGALPDWSRVDPEKLRSWIGESKAAMRKRNDFLHADSFHTRNSDSEYVPVYMSSRSGERMEQTVEGYRELALELRSLGRRGNDLENDLLPLLRDDFPGVYDMRYPDPSVSLAPKPRMPD